VPPRKYITFVIFGVLLVLAGIYLTLVLVPRDTGGMSDREGPTITITTTISP